MLYQLSVSSEQLSGVVMLNGVKHLAGSEQAAEDQFPADFAK